MAKVTVPGEAVFAAYSGFVFIPKTAESYKQVTPVLTYIGHGFGRPHRYGFDTAFMNYARTRLAALDPSLPVIEEKVRLFVEMNKNRSEGTPEERKQKANAEICRLAQAAKPMEIAIAEPKLPLMRQMGRFLRYRRGAIRK